MGYIFNKEVETMTRSEMEALQSERLVEAVKRVYNNVKTYREKMQAVGLAPSDIKSIKDIVKLPFTTKKDLRDNYPFGMFSADPDDIVRLHASSGTTGKLTVVGYTKKDLEIWSEVTGRAFAMAGMDKTSTFQIAYGYGLFTGGLGAHYGGEYVGARVVPISTGNTERQIMLMKDFGVTHLGCTPSYALHLAEGLRKSGYDRSEFKLKAGIFGAEPWTKEMRKDIEKELGIEAFDIYGLSEICGPGVAMECNIHDGSHVQEDHFYPEIVDVKTLEPIGDGKRGELVFTTLTKEGIPLIRYRTRDITSLTHEPCACGRTTVRMARVTGRSDDMLIIRGVNVFPSQIESVLMREAGVTPHYQIIVDRINNKDTLEIEVEMNEAFFSDEVKEIELLKSRLEDEMRSNISVSAKIRLVSTGTIPRFEGKAKRIIDKRKFD